MLRQSALDRVAADRPRRLHRRSPTIPSPCSTRAKLQSKKGVVKEVQWTNPHVWVRMAVQEDGKEVDYSYEGAAVAVLKRVGWQRDSVKVGDKVTVVGHPYKDGRPGRKHRTSGAAGWTESGHRGCDPGGAGRPWRPMRASFAMQGGVHNERQTGRCGSSKSGWRWYRASWRPPYSRRIRAATPFKLGTFQENGREFIGLVLQDTQIVDIAAANKVIRTPPPAGAQGAAAGGYEGADLPLRGGCGAKTATARRPPLRHRNLHRMSMQ